VADLAAVCAFARRSRDFLSGGLRRSFISAAAAAATLDLLLELLLLFALLSSFAVLLQTLLLFPGPAELSVFVGNKAEV